MRKKRLKGLCPKCLKVNFLQRHHIRPLRFFRKNNTMYILHLCDTCHKEIEEILPQHRKLTKDEYLDIHKQWMQGKTITVYPIKKRKFEKYWTNQGRKQFLQQKEVMV